MQSEHGRKKCASPPLQSQVLSETSVPSVAKRSAHIVQYAQRVYAQRSDEMQRPDWVLLPVCSAGRWQVPNARVVTSLQLLLL